MKLGLIQMTSSDTPEENRQTLENMIRTAHAAGATLICTPEVSNCVSMDRAHQARVLTDEAADTTLAAMRDLANELKVWLALGSLALSGGDDGRFVNRSFLIDPTGAIAGRYDKIHMFDVQISADESYLESSGYAPGSNAVLVDTALAKIGMTVCYDVRFPHLYRALAKDGAEILLVPSAFSPVTGAAHWEVLLRARAIEAGCFVVAAAQSGQHPSQSDKKRSTYGHSMVVAPWGEVLLDAGTDAGVSIVEIDLNDVSKARRRLPTLLHDRHFDGP